MWWALSRACDRKIPASPSMMDDTLQMRDLREEDARERLSWRPLGIKTMKKKKKNGRDVRRDRGRLDLASRPTKVNWKAVDYLFI